jgi:hypothetical protein
MRIKLPKIRILLAVGLFVFSLVLFAFLNTYVNEKNTIANSLEEKWQVEELRRENIKNLEHFLEEKSGDISLLDVHFVASGDVVTFLDLVENLGKQVSSKSEVTLIDIPKDNSGLLVEVRSEGSFDSIYKFLRLLENAPYELEIVSLEMSTSSGEEESYPVWDSTFRIKLISFI